jgi:two-component system, OmpR family, sensor kinase
MGQSLGARILMLVAGGSIVLSIVLAVIAYSSGRSYYTNVTTFRAASFAERVLALDNEFWATYQRSPGQFSERMQPLITYEPNTGLYVVGLDGRILATAGEEKKIHWTDNYRVDLTAIRVSAQSEPGTPVLGTDPDHPKDDCHIVARPIMHEGEHKAWLYVVARSASSAPELPSLMSAYAIKGAVKIALITLAIGVLVTVGVLAMVARPLSALTQAAEVVRSSPDPTNVRLGDLAKGTVLPDSNPDSALPFTERNDEIGSMARSFEAMLNRLRAQAKLLQDTDASRRSMVAGVSHDLRTPITALTSQLETLRLKYQDLTPSDRDKYLTGALNNAVHLRKLTDALSDLARFANPDMKAQLEPTNVGDLLEDLVSRYMDRAQVLGVSLKATYNDGLPLVQADATLIDRALTNMIDNALRVASPNDSIELGALLCNNESVRVSVSDTGPGISAHDLTHIFDDFYQASNHRQHRGSAGLGLAIVRRAIQLHGSEVTVRSVEGEGTTFEFDLQTVTRKIDQASF